MTKPTTFIVSKDLLSKKLHLCYLNGTKFFVFEEKGSIYYKRLPEFVRLFKESKSNVLFNLELLKNGASNANVVKNLNSFNIWHRSKLVMKGLGLKARFGFRKKFIELRLGYSHPLRIKMDSQIKAGIEKSILVFSSLNKSKLGNFVYKIRKLRFPNPYKGKGIWYKNERFNLKVIKKK